MITGIGLHIEANWQLGHSGNSLLSY